MKFKVTTWDNKKETIYTVEATGIVEATDKVEKIIRDNIPKEYIITLETGGKEK